MPVTFYAHLVWTTDRRAPLIDKTVARFLRYFLPATARRHGARVIEMGIVSDHVHLIVGLPAVVDIPRLVQALKGGSSRVANRDHMVSKSHFRWAAGYSLRSVSPQALARVSEYVRNQPRRHPLDRIGE